MYIYTHEYVNIFGYLPARKISIRQSSFYTYIYIYIYMYIYIHLSIRIYECMCIYK